MHFKLFSFFRKQGGYTLAELLVVISIIGALMTLAVPSFNFAKQQAAILKIRTDLKSIDSVLNSQEIENLAPSEITVDNLVKSGYLDSLPSPPASVPEYNLSKRQYEIDPKLNRAFIQLDANTRCYADTSLPIK